MLFNSIKYFLTDLYLNAVIKKVEISKKYQNLISVFSKKLVNKLSVYDKHDHEIKTESKQSLFRLIHNLFVIKLATLWTYINENLKKSFIRESCLLSKTLILFIKKKDNLLYLCVDDWDLNVIIIKNYY